MGRILIKRKTAEPQPEQDAYLAGITAKDAPTKPPSVMNLGLFAKYDELRLQIRIDPDRLDQMVLEQPQVYLEVCEQCTSAMSLRDAARDALARKDSELARAARVDLEAKGVRPTEAVINDMVLLHPERKHFRNEHEQLKNISDKWGNLRAAFEQRLRMLRELVALHGMGYHQTVQQDRTQRASRDVVAASVRAAQDKARKER